MPQGEAMTRSHDGDRRYARGGTYGGRGVAAVTDDTDEAEQAGDRLVWLLAIAVAALVGGWGVAALTFDEANFAVHAPQVRLSLEVGTALARLFGAMALLMFPASRASERLRWVGGGLVILAIGAIAFGYLNSVLDVTTNPNRLIYAAIATHSLAGVLFAYGLLPATPRPFTARTMLAALSAFAVISLLVVYGTDLLPHMTRIANLDLAVASGDTPPPGLTGWYWAICMLPLGLSILAVIGAGRHYPGEALGGWMVVAMVLWAGMQLHSVLWPSTFMPVVTTATVLRSGFAVVLVVGGYLELHGIARHREALLLAEREYARRTEELAVLKADFTAVVAHELGSPIAAIGIYGEMLSAEDLSHEDRMSAVAGIRSQVSVLHALVADVRAAAFAERDDFAVQVQPVAVAELLVDAAMFARTVAASHPVTIAAAPTERVWADRERIGQVLRNLIDNAAKYAPLGTSIDLRVTRAGNALRFEVVDHGPGIDPDDLGRIFEKFGRGQNQRDRFVPGTGLGLYLSRRIVQAHGSDLTVESTPDAGSVFGFALEVVR